MILSEDQATIIGLDRAKDGGEFTVFWYVDPRTKLTMFGVEISATKEVIFGSVPRAAAPAHHDEGN